MFKKIMYQMLKHRYSNALPDRSFYEKNVECFFSGHHATVVMTSEAELRRNDAEKTGNVVDFYDYKNCRRPCIAILKGNKVLIMDLDVNAVGKQKAKVLSFWEFCRDYEMADKSEVRIIC